MALAQRYGMDVREGTFPERSLLALALPVSGGTWVSSLKMMEQVDWRDDSISKMAALKAGGPC